MAARDTSRLTAWVLGASIGAGAGEAIELILASPAIVGNVKRVSLSLLPLNWHIGWIDVWGGIFAGVGTVVGMYTGYYLAGAIRRGRSSNPDSGTRPRQE